MYRGNLIDRSVIRMQFGVFSVSDITRDAVTGETPGEARRTSSSPTTDVAA